MLSVYRVYLTHYFCDKYCPKNVAKAANWSDFDQRILHEKKDLALRIAPEIKQGLKESNTMVVGKKNIIYFTTTTFCAGRLSTLTK